MQKIFVPDFHKALIEQNDELRNEAISFQNQPLEILKKRPSPEKWSVMECFEHMCILYDIYLKNLTEGLERKGNKYHYTDYFKPTLVGHYFYLSMAPNDKNEPRYKIKTFNRFKPSGDRNDRIEVFLKIHIGFCQQIDRIPILNLDKIKINSSIGPIMRFKLGDLFRIVTGHNQRHIIQARNTLRTVNG